MLILYHARMTLLLLLEANTGSLYLISVPHITKDAYTLMIGGSSLYQPIGAMSNLLSRRWASAFQLCTNKNIWTGYYANLIGELYVVLLMMLLSFPSHLNNTSKTCVISLPFSSMQD